MLTFGLNDCNIQSITICDMQTLNNCRPITNNRFKLTAIKYKFECVISKTYQLNFVLNSK